MVHISQATRDIQRFPQFKPTVAPADTTVRASARTYFYATEKKCDDVMKNFLSCVNMAGIYFISAVILQSTKNNWQDGDGVEQYVMFLHDWQ